MGRGVRGRDVGHCRLNLAVLYAADAAERFLEVYQAESGYVVDRAVDVRELLGFDLEWPVFIPEQVAGRCAVDSAGMAAWVRELLTRSLAR